MYKGNCKQCGAPLTGSQKLFCSRSCASTFNNLQRGPRSEETKLKIKLALEAKYPSSKRRLAKNKIGKKDTTKEIRQCKICQSMFSCVPSSLRQTCSSKCSKLLRQNQALQKHKQAYENYLQNQEVYCRGNYTPKAFKNEFLQEQNGICAICGCKPEHNGKPLVFVLDHIDGNASNNKRTNLRMICPNCDSQLDTFKSKNKNSARRNYWKEKIIKDYVYKKGM